MYFKRMFIDSDAKAIVEYDTADGGADLIISLTGDKKDSIVIGVGVKKTTSRQVAQTLANTGGRYGLFITDQPLDIDTANTA